MQMVLSFELPFALIPLLKFCNSSKKVGPLKESIYVRKPSSNSLISDKEYMYLMIQSQVSSMHARRRW